MKTWRSRILLNDVPRVSCAVLLDSCSPMDGYFMAIAALPQCTEVLTLPCTALCLFVWLWENSCNVRERAYPYSLTCLSHRGSALLLSAAPLTGRRLWKHSYFEFILAQTYPLFTSLCMNQCVHGVLRWTDPSVFPTVLGIGSGFTTTLSRIKTDTMNEWINEG